MPMYSSSRLSIARSCIDWMARSSRQLRGVWSQFLTDGTIPEEFKMPLFLGVLIFAVFLPLYLLYRKLNSSSSSSNPASRNRQPAGGIHRHVAEALVDRAPVAAAPLLLPCQSQQFAVHVRLATTPNDQFAMKDLTYDKLLMIAGLPASSVQEVCVGFDQDTFQDNVLLDLKHAIRVIRSKLTVIIRSSNEDFEKSANLSFSSFILTFLKM
eukprot:TRINITY_DN7063_c0_g1_i1.p1 TRINITY_DN7063_c0_g1~~TRINITY_DN7063_c0_g1_i1.p1  ORF type:complete len:211 (-),score=48.25 TRINITY_DN7063_c0_g1_i1:82-714(-)